MRIKKRYLWIGLAVVFVVGIVLFSPLRCSIPLLSSGCEKKIEEVEKINPAQTSFSIDERGFVKFPARSEILFSRQNHSETDNVTISKIMFKSRDHTIYGLLVLPKKVNKALPGMVLIPGAGVSKESELALATNISSLGVAVLTYDQRGTGETKGAPEDMQQQYDLYRQGLEPQSYFMIYDALRAYDLLASADFVDKNHIVMAGESLGGRNALIATALEENIKGALIMSSAGFGLQSTGNSEADKFLQSIDPDYYIASIYPRKIVFMHNEQDKTVPIGAAAMTYNRAPGEKRFVAVNDTSCNHGYCESMYLGMLAGMEFLYN